MDYLYYRYVDNILANLTEKVINILEKFSSYYNFLKCIIKIKENRNLNFLNLLLKVNDKFMLIDFTKKTFFIVLSFYYNHPKYHKLGIISILYTII